MATESERGTASFTLPSYASALAPTLLTPADLAVTDGTGFTWEFNTANVGATQQQFAFKATIDGVDGWWDGSGWQTAETYVTSAVESLTLPAGAWDDFPTTVTYWVDNVESDPNNFGVTSGQPYYDTDGPTVGDEATFVADGPNPYLEVI